MRCGLCGGEVRGFRGTLHGRPIADWKHKSAPPGTAPHRPVLGTPVDEESLERLRRMRRDYFLERSTIPEPSEPSPPIIRPGRSWSWNMPQSAGTILMLAGQHDWTTLEPPTYFQASDGAEYLVVKLRRRDLGAVGCWLKRPATGGRWAFDVGFTLAKQGLNQVGSKQLKDWIAQPDEECPDCGASSAAHREGECP